MENQGKWTETVDASITNRMKDMEEKISSVEDIIEEINLSVKENVKSNKFLALNI